MQDSADDAMGEAVAEHAKNFKKTSGQQKSKAVKAKQLEKR